jgi:hypothetical protein
VCSLVTVFDLWLVIALSVRCDAVQRKEEIERDNDQGISHGLGGVSERINFIPHEFLKSIGVVSWRERIGQS